MGEVFFISLGLIALGILLGIVAELLPKAHAEMTLDKVGMWTTAVGGAILLIDGIVFVISVVIASTAH